MNALIVDADESIRRLLARILHEQGYDTILARNSAEALKCLSEARIDIVLVDANLGMEDGITLAEQLHKANRELRTIVMSGNPGNASRVEQIGLGRLLCKPFTMATLRDAIASE